MAAKTHQSSILDLNDTRAASWPRFEDELGLAFLEMPTQTPLYRGYNPRQKKDRPEFFAFLRSFAERYGSTRNWMTTRPLRLLETHYVIDLDECCLRNAYILERIAKERKDPLVLRAINQHLLQDYPTDSDTISLDSALAQLVCSLGFDGWIRLSDAGNTDEAMICQPAISVELVK